MRPLWTLRLFTRFGINIFYITPCLSFSFYTALSSLRLPCLKRKILRFNFLFFRSCRFRCIAYLLFDDRRRIGLLLSLRRRTLARVYRPWDLGILAASGAASAAACATAVPAVAPRAIPATGIPVTIAVAS
jgi:hypothetical protein